MKISTSIDPHKLDKNKIIVFWALDNLENEENDRFKPGEIVNHLIDNYSINISKRSVEYILKSNKDSVHRNNSGYKLMQIGRDQLEESLVKENILIIEPGKPFSAKNISLKKVFDSLKDTIYISDPYIDLKTLDVIFRNINIKTKIKILTSNVIDKPNGIIARQLKELRDEGFDIELKLYSNSELHDRYLFDNNNFWLSGNSLNSLGTKESFIIKLSEEIRQVMLSVFNSRWKSSTEIK